MATHFTSHISNQRPKIDFEAWKQKGRIIESPYFYDSPSIKMDQKMMMQRYDKKKYLGQIPLSG